MSGGAKKAAGRRVPAKVRVGVSAVVFAAVTLATVWVTPWSVAVLLGWDAAALIFLIGVWWTVRRMEAHQTRRHAVTVDESRAVFDVVLILASVASLVGVGFDLLKASSETGTARALETLVAVVSVAISWAAVHAVFMIRYADLYYAAGGGIDFHQHDKLDPDFADFAYMAFTIGMTYQVSDTDLTSKTIRRTALRHGLLSFVFGTAVIAMTINVVASLLNH